MGILHSTQRAKRLSKRNTLVLNVSSRIGFLPLSEEENCVLKQGCKNRHTLGLPKQVRVAAMMSHPPEGVWLGFEISRGLLGLSPTGKSADPIPGGGEERQILGCMPSGTAEKVVPRKRGERGGAKTKKNKNIPHIGKSEPEVGTNTS